MLFKIHNNKRNHIPYFDKENKAILSVVGNDNYKSECGFIYIYVLYDEYTKEVFYVGKTINPTERLNSHWKNTEVKKDNFKYHWIEFLKNEDLILYLDIIDKVPFNEWDFWEKHYISLYRSWGFKLANIAFGGAGSNGFKHTDEAIEKIRKSSTNRLHKEESKKLISINRQGIQFSETHLKNLSLSHQGQVHKSLLKPIVQIDINNGNIINEYESIKQAELNTGFGNSALTACCKGRLKSVGGYYWCYKSELDNFVFKPYKRDYYIPKTKKAVLKISEDGNVLSEYDSLLGASKDLGKSDGARNNINNAIKNKRKAYGFYWKLKN